MITIIDYKTGNLGSIQNMLKKIGESSIITSDFQRIEQATKLILPGVGSFDTGVKKLRDSGLWDIINKKVTVDKIPVLGICLGAQLMTQNSEEGLEQGFGWVNAGTVRFSISKDSKLKVPNMGWNYVYQKKSSKIFDSMYEQPRFYFVHSYHFKFFDPAQILTISNYSYEFPSSFEFENIIGVQFHPEKSHKFGMLLLKNFSSNY